MTKEKFHDLDVRKDFASRFLFDKWQNYFAALIFFFFLNITANLYSRTLIHIDVGTLPYEKAILLEENISLVPYVKDVRAIFVFPIAIGIFFIAKRFFSYIPQAFEIIFTNNILKKKKGSSSENLPIDYDKSIKEFEGLINSKKMYLLASFLYIFVILVFCLSEIPIEEITVLWWTNIDFFPVCWIVSSITAPLMWFYVGIFIWKMFSIVFFMWQLSSQYEFTLKPYNPDGFGGMKPLGQLWLNMIFVAILVIVAWLIMFFFLRSFGIVYPLQPRVEFLIIILYTIFILILLIYPMQSYHRLIEREKANLLKDIESKIKYHYKKIEKAILSTNTRNLDTWSVEQIKYYHEIAIKIKSIPSWPFSSSEKISIILSVIIPWVLQGVDYLI